MTKKSKCCGLDFGTLGSRRQAEVYGGYLAFVDDEISRVIKKDIWPA